MLLDGEDALCQAHTVPLHPVHATADTRDPNDEQDQAADLPPLKLIMQRPVHKHTHQHAPKGGQTRQQVQGYGECGRTDGHAAPPHLIQQKSGSARGKEPVENQPNKHRRKQLPERDLGAKQGQAQPEDGCEARVDGELQGKCTQEPVQLHPAQQHQDHIEIGTTGYDEKYAGYG